VSFLVEEESFQTDELFENLHRKLERFDAGKKEGVRGKRL
jgi:hypothetical protein